MNFKKILKKHKIWLNGEKGGKCVDLKNADLRNTDLIGANLIGVNLKGVNLIGINLTGASLIGADLRNANLSYTDLSGADLRNSNLENADLWNANLSGANLSGANLKNIKTNTNTMGYHLACPEKGSFIGYKRANGCIIELLILEDAKRSSATTSRCRCDKAKVLDIEDIMTGRKVEEIRSNYDSKFIYKVGEIVKVDNFDDDRWNECSTGIHFFMNKDNAINY